MPFKDQSKNREYMRQYMQKRRQTKTSQTTVSPSQPAPPIITTETTPLNPPQVPRILVKWLRFQDHFAFTRPNTYLALGGRGSGKSNLLEVLGIRYPKIIDLFGASDNEGLCWCKPEFEQLFQTLYNRPPNILLVRGKSRDVASKHDSIKIQDLQLTDFETHDVITTVHAFYENEEEYFEALHIITVLLWEKRTYWKEPWYVLIREAANWIYARMKITKDDKMAKADFIKSLREARHHGLAIGVDTIRWTAIDKEVRDISDYIFIKRAGSIGLPDDLRWVYRYIRPYSMMQAKSSVFMLITSKGAVGFGKCDYAPWHKEEKENILKTANIEVKHSDQQLPDDRRYGVGDFEHSEIIIKYMELKSMNKVANALSRSPRTVNVHINQHNLAVERKGECKKCHHADCHFSKDTIIAH
mgnify:FL=1